MNFTKGTKKVNYYSLNSPVQKNKEMYEKIKQSAEFIKQQGVVEPVVGIILGTGLGGLVKDIEIEISIDYQDIPNFPVSTVESHHCAIHGQSQDVHPLLDHLNILSFSFSLSYLLLL